MGQILLVEDDGLVQRILGDELEYLGHSILSATSPDEAVRLISSPVAVDLVVTDIEFGVGLDGVHLAKWITETYPLIHVIGMSGNHTAADRLKVVNPRIQFFPKPFSVESLMEHIEARLERV